MGPRGDGDRFRGGWQEDILHAVSRLPILFQYFAESLPDVRWNYMSDKYPYGMKTKSFIETSARGHAEREFNGTSGGPVDILVVEDDDSQRASIVLALQDTIPDVVVVAVRSGPEALDFLFSRDAWVDRVGEDPPKLILLDLALPGSNGFSVLGQIRSIEPQDALTLTPVVVFTDSQAIGDISESYRCGANSYVIKPLSFPDFRTVVESVGQYWMTLNKTLS
jgi:CheY-like chemotaxis protein